METTILGIDHGNGNIKIASSVFPCGFKKQETKPTAKMVYGRKAWEQMGHMVCEEAEPINLLFPHIKEMMSADKSVYHVEYRDVCCFDLDSTQGSNSVGKKRTVIFADRITQLTGATWELISEEALRDALGQMKMYVNYYDCFEKLQDENPTIGILLCKEKNDALVEITLPENSNIYAAEYSLYLPDKKLLQAKLQEWINEAEEEA